ncbi:GAF domain-containing protein [Chroococcidiopsis sp. FACHB-1243]|uniref:GAF domain-containing protein n=1 Tax=Chroococcidiopsis sp. [FACHB-1243] TaxID=2692781 RepID=UPI00178462FB|nr:GAF domain-containing protein [Chroococcidiopsis sp. [FACHB-1243]]MBD2305171.1 GAF domain-containing protein [Chroococcidiopsis sp. [FACHB-1243]]
MSQIPFHFAEQYSTRRRTTTSRCIQFNNFSSITIHDSRDNYPPSCRNNPDPGTKLSKHRLWWQKSSFRTKLVALIIAVGILPVLTDKSLAQADDRLVPQFNAQAEARVDNPDLADSPTQLPVTLLIETVVASLLLIGLLTAFFANRAMRPAKSAVDAGEKPKLEPDDSYSPLAILNSAALEKVDVSHQQIATIESAKIATEISLKFRQAQYLNELLKTATKEIRRALSADRVFVYQFNPDWSGNVVAESVLPGLPSCLKIKITDTYFSESNEGVEKYINGRICVTHDIYGGELTDCHIKLLEQFAIKAQMVAPITKNGQLFGLLIVNQCSEPRLWLPHEVELFSHLAKQVGVASEQVTFLEKQEADAERADLLTEITLRIQQAQFLEELLKTAVKEVRRAIKTDRVVVYGLDSSNWDGIVVAESVAPGWPQTLRVRIDDPCMREKYAEIYKQGHVTVIDDIYQAGRVEDCYRRLLEQFAVKANLVAPILKNNELLGLLIAHHCSEPRNWQQEEIDLFVQLATQIGFAIDRVSLMEEMETDEE